MDLVAQTKAYLFIKSCILLFKTFESHNWLFTNIPKGEVNRPPSRWVMGQKRLSRRYKRRVEKEGQFVLFLSNLMSQSKFFFNTDGV